MLAAGRRSEARDDALRPTLAPDPATPSGLEATHLALAPSAPAVGMQAATPPPPAPSEARSDRGRRRWLVASLAAGAVAVGAVTTLRAVHASPLRAPGTVLACPPLLVSGVEAPSGWLGAAAADLACRRAGWALGGHDARYRLPAELLDLPREVTNGFPRDVYADPGARARAVDGAGERRKWLDQGAWSPRAMASA